MSRLDLGAPVGLSPDDLLRQLEHAEDWEPVDPPRQAVTPSDLDTSAMETEQLPAGGALTVTVRLTVDPETLNAWLATIAERDRSDREQRARSILGSAYQWPHRHGRRAR